MNKNIVIREYILKELHMRKFIEQSLYSNESVLNQMQIHPCAFDIT